MSKNWSRAAVKATAGIGGLGLMGLLMDLLSGFGMELPFPVIFVLSFTPAVVFSMTGDLAGRPWLRIAELAAVVWYALATLASIAGVVVLGPQPHHIVFLAFVAVGVWPCVVAWRGPSAPRQVKLDASLGPPGPGMDPRYAPGQGRIVLLGVARRSLRTLVVSLVFVALGLVPSLQRNHPVIAWTSIVFFGAFALLTLLQLTWPAARGSLTLDADGFEISTFGRRHRRHWSDLEGFGTISIQDMPMISIRYRPGYQGQRAARKFSASLSGVEGGLPDIFEVQGLQLAQLLEAWRARYTPGARPAGPSIPA